MKDLFGIKEMKRVLIIEKVLADVMTVPQAADPLVKCNVQLWNPK